ncbi:MAG TPA: hypothetical protein PKO06_04115 [Candidatus Ozemobacteraceae bacterium]|nr:hypothetical protein [Candidatus Ozemobacteraceae bacterium]
MMNNRGIAWLLLVAFIFLLAFIGGAGVYWRLNSNFVKPPLSTKLQIDYQLESALLLVFQTIAAAGPEPLPATFTYEPPRREIMPGVVLSVRTVQRTPEEVQLEAQAVGSRLERYLSARLFRGIASGPEMAERSALLPALDAASASADLSSPSTDLTTGSPTWLIELLQRRTDTP